MTTNNSENENYKCEDQVVLIEEFSEDLIKDIRELIRKEGYLVHSIDVRKISTGGNNFLGELYEVNVKGKTNDGDKEVNIFLKRIIKNDDFKVYSIPEVYRKEAFVYNELSKIYGELQETANVPAEEMFRFVKSFDETNSEVIILENLAKSGFKTISRMNIMSLEFAELSVEQLAKFHGLSFVLERKKPEYFVTKIKTIKQSFVYDDYWNEFVKNMCEFSTTRVDDATKRKIDKFFLESLEKYPKYMNGLHSHIKCLCHGDYKMNNILMREEPSTEVIPIDYQQIYYGCPVIDLIYFIYAASDREFRKRHFDHLIDLYYTSLTRYLDYFDVDVATVFSRSDFEDCVKSSLDYGLIYTLYMLPMFFVNEGVPDLAKDELLDIKMTVDESFYDRMQGIIDEFVEMGVL